MRRVAAFCLLFIFLLAQFPIMASGQNLPPDEAEPEIVSHETTAPQFPDLYPSDIYGQINPLAEGEACILRDDVLDFPTILFESYADFLESWQTEQLNFDLFFPLGVHCQYVDEATGNECHYSYTPALGVYNVSVDEAVEMLFVMDDFWGAVEFLVSPSTTLLVQDEKRVLVGYMYCISCPPKGGQKAKVYVGITINLDTRFTDKHPVWSMICDDKCTVKISPIYSIDYKPIPQGQTELQIKLNILRSQERLKYLKLKEDEDNDVQNKPAGILTKEKAKEYIDKYKPSVGKARDMKFKKTGEKKAKPVYCDPNLPKNQQLPGYTPPEVDEDE